MKLEITDIKKEYQWIARNLTLYGNCAIGKKLAKERLDELYNELSKINLKCELSMIDSSYELLDGSNKTKHSITYVLNKSL